MTWFYTLLEIMSVGCLVHGVDVGNLDPIIFGSTFFVLTVLFQIKEHEEAQR